jgi:NADPH:quinone reductase-like Zn-dependent oxidoreductase
VRKLTEGRGVDAVFDHVGETVWPIAVESLRWGGRMVICGATEGFQPTLDLRFLWNKQLTLLGSHIGTAAEWAQALRLIENGRIKPPVTRVFPLSEVRAAQELMETRGVMGKIAVSIGAS